MSSTLPGLRMLVRLKTRRVAQCDEALRQRRLEQALADDALREQCDAEEQVRVEERRQQAHLADTMDKRHSIRGSDIVTLHLLLKEAAQHSAAAAQQTERAQGVHRAAVQRVAAADRQLQRVRQQLEVTDQRLQQALAERERAQEDVQDEEAEETAVARMIAATRARRADPGEAR